jgi:hypothetical protein
VFGAQPISRATRHARHSSRSSASMVSMLHIRGRRESGVFQAQSE